jgi:hypothetical protein
MLKEMSASCEPAVCNVKTSVLAANTAHGTCKVRRMHRFYANVIFSCGECVATDLDGILRHGLDTRGGPPRPGKRVGGLAARGRLGGVGAAGWGGGG